MSLEKPIIPTFSLKERDRRWNLLRQAMRTAGLDAVVSLPNEGHWDQFGCDTRCMTAGLGAMSAGRAEAYSAKEPSQVP